MTSPEWPPTPGETIYRGAQHPGLAVVWVEGERMLVMSSRGFRYQLTRAWWRAWLPFIVAVMEAPL